MSAKASDPDKISPSFLKECVTELCTSLCVFYNKPLAEGVVPEEWGRSNITPVFKSKDEQDVTNYRPYPFCQ